MSGGTRASAAGVMLSAGFAWHGGRRRPSAAAATDARSKPPTASRRGAISASASEHFALPRIHPTLRDVDVYPGLVRPGLRRGAR